MKYPLDVRFFELIRCVHSGNEHADEALHELSTSVHFGRPSIFFYRRWHKLVQLVDGKQAHARVKAAGAWHTLVTPALLLSIRELEPDKFVAMFEGDAGKVPMDRDDSALYSYLRVSVANEIQRDLLDGNTVYEYTHREIEWPEAVDEDGDDSDFVPAVFPDRAVDIEATALDNLILEQAREMVSEMEWEIITAEHGDGPMLAEKYGLSESNIHTIKHRTIKRLQEEFCKESI